MSHHSDGLEKWYEELRGNKKASVQTVCSLASIEGYVECGVGIDEQEAREDYVLKITDFMKVLDEARVRIMYDQVKLDYTVIKGD